MPDSSQLRPELAEGGLVLLPEPSQLGLEPAEPMFLSL